MSSSGNARGPQRSSPPPGRWWSKLIDGRKRVTPNSNFKELLSALNRCGAKYLVVGGYAVMLYTEPRYTKDLDIWVEASAENALLVFKALAEFGAPLKGIQAADSRRPI